MMKKLMCVIVAIVIVIGVLGCQKTETTISTNQTTANSQLTTYPTSQPMPTVTIEPNHMQTFSFSQMNDVSFSLQLNPETFIVLEGQNITTDNYSIDDAGDLVIDYGFLATLLPGTYSFTIYKTSGTDVIYLEVEDESQQYQIINGGFEYGNLLGWTASTIFKGETNLLSFRDELVVPTDSDSTTYNGDGSYLYGFDYSLSSNQSLLIERMGRLTSSDFILGGNGMISFKLGAGSNPDLSYLSVKERDTNEEIARFGNLLFDSDTFLTDSEGKTNVELFSYYADLSNYIGDQLYIEVYDYGGHDYDYLLLDSINTYHTSVPTDAIEAQNIMPIFDQAYITNELPNGDFSSGLDEWTVSTYGRGFEDATQMCFLSDNEVLKSNLNGDQARGLIRSSLFRVDGSGVISLEIGAAQGSRFDKDTYVSIREYQTNEEVFRFANRNHDGTTMMMYYLDLSEYMGDYLYFEIVDNGGGSWDTIFVDNIVTYYAEEPIYDYSQAAVNLNE